MTRERPIMFSAPMVRAILEGRKSQTRRIVKHRKTHPVNIFDGTWTDEYVLDPGNAEWRNELIGYRVGDSLWVKETWFDAHVPGSSVLFAADEPDVDPICRKRSAMFMPKRVARIWLRVTDVRVERLHGISEEDARAEGIEPTEFGWRCYLPEPKGQDAWCCPVESFRTLWTSINGPGAWDANPWVVVISFEVESTTGRKEASA